jgi:hypothetical protein
MLYICFVQNGNQLAHMDIEHLKGD